jgi:hypothetical protein
MTANAVDLPEDDLDGSERAELARQADAALALLTRVDAAGVE